MEVSNQLHIPATLPFKERVPIIHCIGGWVCLRASLDIMEMRKISCPCHELNPDSPPQSMLLYRLSYLDSYSQSNKKKIILLISFQDNLSQNLSNFSKYISIINKQKYNLYMHTETKHISFLHHTAYRISESAILSFATGPYVYVPVTGSTPSSTKCPYISVFLTTGTVHTDITSTKST